MSGNKACRKWKTWTEHRTKYQIRKIDVSILCLYDRPSNVKNKKKTFSEKIKMLCVKISVFN